MALRHPQEFTFLLPYCVTTCGLQSQIHLTTSRWLLRFQPSHYIPGQEEESDTKEGNGKCQLPFKEITSKASCDTSAYLTGQDLAKGTHLAALEFEKRRLYSKLTCTS